MIKYAIFDADGTLFDSMEIWDGFANRYLEKIGIINEENINEKLAGLCLKESAEYIIKKYNLNMIADKVCDDITDMLESYYFNDAKIKPGIKELLFELKMNNVKMCIATSSQKKLIDGAAKNNNIFDYFEFILTSNEVGVGKSKPDIFLTAAKMLGGDISSTIVFEDTAHAAITAKNAGFIVCGVYDKFEENFPIDNVDYYFNNLLKEKEKFFEKYFKKRLDFTY